jgi:hypothetical protein
MEIRAIGMTVSGQVGWIKTATSARNFSSAYPRYLSAAEIAIKPRIAQIAIIAVVVIVVGFLTDRDCKTPWGSKGCWKEVAATSEAGHLSR